MARGKALITGASSGIGEALARQFAEKGFDLIITARRESRLQDLAEALENGGDLGGDVKVQIVACDLSTTTGMDYLLDAIDPSSIDVLVNNAGVAYPGTFPEQNFEDIASLLSLNITALTRLIHAILPSMIEKGAGRIMNVASVASFQPVPSMSVYAASKAFVLSLTESLSEELKGSGVSTTALCPGITKTDLLENLQGAQIPPFMMSTSKEVAREGYEALMNKEVIRIPGIANQAAVTWAKHQPRWLVRGLGGLAARFKPN
ncbi:MAG: SDR family oxidoreductase [Pseudomonadales bacterium]|nr:SDR family oxidoreductase [Pseudomonadales bacterium]